MIGPVLKSELLANLCLVTPAKILDSTARPPRCSIPPQGSYNSFHFMPDRHNTLGRGAARSTAGRPITFVAAAWLVRDGVPQPNEQVLAPFSILMPPPAPSGFLGVLTMPGNLW